MNNQELIRALKWHKEHTIDGMVNVHCAKCEHAGFEKALELIEQLDELPQKPCGICSKLGQQPNCYQEIFQIY